MRTVIVHAVLLSALFTAATRTRAPAQTNWSRYDEAATLLSRTDTSLFLDTLPLERIRSALERSRAAFPELRRIVDVDFEAATLRLAVFMLPDDGRAALAEQVRRALRSGRRESRRVEVASTGMARLDSLNAAFRAVRVTAPLRADADSLDTVGYLAIEFARPANIPRIEKIYAANGIESGVFGGLTTWFYPVVNWRPGERADELHFRLDSDCRAPMSWMSKTRASRPWSISGVGRWVFP